ncbi:MAG: hypothetical protein ACERKD_17765 [Prolixibacteraceae bacterium]
MELLPTILVVVVLLGLAFFGMAIQAIFSRRKRFPNTHIGGNKNMMSHGITCAQSWDKMEQRKVRQIKYDRLN